mmetsp:Transcript_10848/g.19720  ORF Transcript_10848/g.19720 Transcript_10848/m.19720 type:complete len:715 (+) Transcript_10848:138-2282(+)
MSSTKKKKNRGKQRKAQAAAASSPSSTKTNNGNADLRAHQLHQHLELQQKHLRYNNTFLTRSPASVVEDIRRGKDLSTQAVVALSGSAHDQIVYRQRLVDEGMIEVVLGLLKRCVNEEFMDVLVDIGGEEGDGGLAGPSVWVNILLNTTAPGNFPDPRKLDECRLQIAESIAPLANCMIDDSKREFYKNNMQWHGCIFYFVALLQNLVLTKETVASLLQYEGLADMLIQSMFWESDRPDIMKESKSHGTFVITDNFSKIAFSAGYVVQEIVDVGENGVFNKEEKKHLDFLARTPTISKAYSPDAGTTFAVGLTQLLKSKTSSVKKTHIFWIMNMLSFADCVDRSVIEGVVEFGTDIAMYEDAEPVIDTVYNMVIPSTPGNAPIPNDSRFAIAINAGLLEMCLKIVLRFEGYLDDDLVNHVTMLLHGASAVAMLKKSSEAIAKRRSLVLRMLQLSDQNAQINDKCQEIIRTIRSIVQTNTGSEAYDLNAKAICRLCYKFLENDAIKRCSRCKRATYCSRECQLDDWHGEHKRDCKHMSKQGDQVKMAGHGKRDIKKAEQHEKNVSMAGAKAFSQNIHTIMLRAIFQECNILDCVVVVDLCQAPPSIELKLVADFLSDLRMNSAENYSHTKRVVDRNRSNGSITCACHSLGVYGETDASGIPATAVLLKTFPGVSTPCGSWTAYQEQMEKDMPEDFDVYKVDPQLREEFLDELNAA